ncbi:hypothetical protein Dsin_007040 [Dipteronia sinensis]|uniref:Uncharacterized protein n=1 Tax=Dipteronia sinensis TaxID=43782 RepID=A0AAE0B0E3_9ROSI|nr:hypothetical protein Dsin_007040 [Dipteronia sinensis]
MVARSTTPMVTLSIVSTTMTKSAGTKFISWISAAKLSSLYEQRNHSFWDVDVGKAIDGAII